MVNLDTVKPTMSMRDCRKNAYGVNKSTALKAYKQEFELAVK